MMTTEELEKHVAGLYEVLATVARTDAGSEFRCPEDVQFWERARRTALGDALGHADWLRRATCRRPVGR